MEFRLSYLILQHKATAEKGLYWRNISDFHFFIPVWDERSEMLEFSSIRSCHFWEAQRMEMNWERPLQSLISGLLHAFQTPLNRYKPVKWKNYVEKTQRNVKKLQENDKECRMHLQQKPSRWCCPRGVGLLLSIILPVGLALPGITQTKVRH